MHCSEVCLLFVQPECIQPIQKSCAIMQNIYVATCSIFIQTYDLKRSLSDLQNKYG